MLMRQTACLVIKQPRLEAMLRSLVALGGSGLGLSGGLGMVLSRVGWGLVLCLWPGPPCFGWWFPLALACGGRLAGGALFCFVSVVGLVLCFRLDALIGLGGGGRCANLFFGVLFLFGIVSGPRVKFIQ